ncbi:hypothetical protein CfE428DRAFT_5076 [Chthoniobacter flavus Ellin428]|uniref:Uncharacterized protein n=1 Tax=Chthoniobacter flavus Ellin428 TaxID=497964 RepID=B4D836_9BACT|nr:hypothetical protein CfE428DRAFT_5076 [Chthoniobacter flavus Ellin428]TCO87361.1 hypothetical protein EV701_12240 [Chthoniobacter flavus]
MLENKCGARHNGHTASRRSKPRIPPTRRKARRSNIIEIADRSATTVNGQFITCSWVIRCAKLRSIGLIKATRIQRKPLRGNSSDYICSNIHRKQCIARLYSSGRNNSKGTRAPAFYKHSIMRSNDDITSRTGERRIPPTRRKARRAGIVEVTNGIGSIVNLNLVSRSRIVAGQQAESIRCTKQIIDRNVLTNRDRITRRRERTQVVGGRHGRCPGRGDIRQRTRLRCRKNLHVIFAVRTIELPRRPRRP